MARLKNESTKGGGKGGWKKKMGQKCVGQRERGSGRVEEAKERVGHAREPRKKGIYERGTLIFIPPQS